MAAAIKGSKEEVPWVDAWVRWERDEKNVEIDDNDDDDDVLPSPTESYTFTYPNPNNDDDNDIVIELKGFHEEDSEQIWNSTGLKLWQSSAVLCQHLVNVEAKMMLQDTTNRTWRFSQVPCRVYCDDDGTLSKEKST
jgi:hypothetical protein